MVKRKLKLYLYVRGPGGEPMGVAARSPESAMAYFRRYQIKVPYLVKIPDVDDADSKYCYELRLVRKARRY